MATRTFGIFVCRRCRFAIKKASQKRHASTSPAIYDVVAVGGGPVGLALLAALSKSTLDAGHLLLHSDLLKNRQLQHRISKQL